MQHIDLKIHEGVATIMMDRAKLRNALSPRLMEDLRTALGDIHQEKKVGAIVLTGRGEDFCSGIDLQVLSEITEMPEQEQLNEWFTLWRQLTELLEDMLRFPRPIIAAIDGACVGAGLALALSCDMVLMSKKARLSALAVRRGLVGGATTALLNFRCGAAVAARMALAGHEIDADEAYRIGIACQPPVDPTQIWVAASQLAADCAKSPREALQANKRLLNEGIGETLMGQLSAGAADSATACTTPSAAEGIKSFLENRDPQWP